MKKIKLFFVSIAMLASYIVTAQISINTDGSIPDASAILDLKSTDKGMLIPCMTQTQIEAIINPTNSLLVFNTTDDKLYVYSYINSKWKEVQYGSSEIVLPSSYSIGTAGSCTNTTVNGGYIEGVVLDASNTVIFDAVVTTVGSWSITTNTLNGYSYSGNGTFITTGTVQVTLDGSGTPITAQTDNFTATANAGGGSCTFDVSVAAAPFTCGNLISYGGQSYTTAQIGTQCWMAENLNIGTMLNGGVNQTDNATIEKHCYNNNPTNCDTYGGMYQWDEMMQYVTTEGAQGICPTGWHLPAQAEWVTLREYLGGYLVAGGKIKETGTSHWNAPNTGATNSSGFTGLPGGFNHEGGSFGNLGFYSLSWSSTESISSHADYWFLGYDYAQLGWTDYVKTSSFSVRCLQD